MKRRVWRKHHKWFGLILVFFMLMFCVSGIVLNHREAVSGVDVSRKWLPSAYRFDRWNHGLLRGSWRCVHTDSMLLYGSNGIWQTDSQATVFADFNEGLPAGTDHRNVRAVVQTADSSLFALTPYALYRRCGAAWRAVGLPDRQDEWLSDLMQAGDTLIVTGRSHLYLSVYPYRVFEKRSLKAPADADGKVSLFRTVWLLHSGELFGTPGKLLMDGVALLLSMLCVTGLLYWLLPHLIRRFSKQGQIRMAATSLLKASLRWHDALGRYAFALLMWVSFTGWCLRPPVLLALVGSKVPPVPGTLLDDDNAWNDKLRLLRYDPTCADWLLSTSEGFYALSSLDAVPVKVAQAPPVSVMGLNVWQKDREGRWLVGSFSGMFVWNRANGKVHDYFTGNEVHEVTGPPFGQRAVSGCVSGWQSAPLVVEYVQGTASLTMPESFSELPMSLWNVALEVHTGRIYTILGQGTLIFIFFAGLAAMWCIYSGYVIRKKPASGSSRRI